MYVNKYCSQNVHNSYVMGRGVGVVYRVFVIFRKKLEVFCGHLLSEDDHSNWAPPFWNIMKESFSLGRTEL